MDMSVRARDFLDTFSSVLGCCSLDIADLVQNHIMVQKLQNNLMYCTSKDALMNFQPRL